MLKQEDSIPTLEIVEDHQDSESAGTGGTVIWLSLVSFIE